MHENLLAVVSGGACVPEACWLTGWSVGSEVGLGVGEGFGDEVVNVCTSSSTGGASATMAWPSPDVTDPGAAMFATSADYSKFMTKVYSGELLASPAQQKMMETPWPARFGISAANHAKDYRSPGWVGSYGFGTWFWLIPAMVCSWTNWLLLVLSCIDLKMRGY